MLAKIKISPLKAHEWALLLLGFMQLPLFIGAAVVLWFFALAWRGTAGSAIKVPVLFNVMQIILAGASLIALLCMLAVVHEGLLGSRRCSSPATAPPRHAAMVPGPHRRWFPAPSRRDLRFDLGLPRPHARLGSLARRSRAPLAALGCKTAQYRPNLEAWRIKASNGNTAAATAVSPIVVRTVLCVALRNLRAILQSGGTGFGVVLEMDTSL
jgi:hypothetical protein